MMKNMDVLLEKYLAGETDLKEEAKLKQLISEQSDSKYESYKIMFEGFKKTQQRSVLKADFERKLLSKLRYYPLRNKKRFIQWSTISIAASIIFAVGFFTLAQKKEAYVIEQGVRYDDMEKAVECADEAIREAIAPLQQSMQSLEPIKGLEGALTPSFNTTPNDSNFKSNATNDSMLKTIN